MALSTREAGIYIGIGESTVRDWIKKGEIEAFEALDGNRKVWLINEDVAEKHRLKKLEKMGVKPNESGELMALPQNEDPAMNTIKQFMTALNDHHVEENKALLARVAELERENGLLSGRLEETVNMQDMLIASLTEYKEAFKAERRKGKGILSKLLGG